MKNRTALIYKISWWLGFTWSPSQRMVNGHGYSWIGKKIRRKRDVDMHTLFTTGFMEGQARATEQYAKDQYYRTIRDL